MQKLQKSKRSHENRYNDKIIKTGYKLINTIHSLYEQVPEDWELRPLGSFAKEINHRYSKSKDGPVLSVTKYKGFVKSLEYFKKQIFSKDINNYKLVEKGNFAYATIHLDEGSLGLLKEFNFGYISPMYTVFQIDSSVDADFLYLLLRSESYLQKYSAIGEGSINRRKSISFDKLSNLNIPLPKLNEQQKISSILSNVDELIQKTDQIIEQTQRLKKGLMQRLLTKGIGHIKLKKTELGQIPEAWKYEKISDNSVLKGRIGWQGLTTAEYLQRGEFYLVTGTDFKDGRIDWRNCVYVDKERYIQDENIQLKKDDVLVTKDGTIGKIAYIDNLPQAATLNSGVFVIRPINKAYFPLFLYYVLRSDIFTKFLNRLKAGSTINHLYQKDFVNFHFPLPPYPEQQEIASILSNIDLLLETQRNEKQSMESLKKGLMQQLLTGKIRVKA